MIMVEYCNEIAELLIDNDFDTELLPTMESHMSYTRRYNNSFAKAKEVYKCDYPFLNLNPRDNAKFRRCIVIQDKMGTMWAMNVSAYDPNKPDKVRRAHKPYSHIINQNLLAQGFDKVVFAQGPVLLPLDMVKLRPIPTGTVDDTTYDECIKAILEAEQYKFRDTFALMNWLKKIQVSPRTESFTTAKIQNVYDIDVSRVANEIDVISCAYNAILANFKEYSDATIYKIELTDQTTNATFDKFSLIYKDIVLNHLRHFRFVLGNPSLGEDNNTKRLTIQDSINGDIHKWILPWYRKTFKSFANWKTFTLTQNQHDIWLHHMVYKKTVAELLNALATNNPVTKVGVYNVFVTK